MEELVSIIIPVYNTAEYLTQCLESVTSQTYRNIEIILVNDGSTDDSLSICQAYASRDPQIKVYSRENAGQGSARNFGISKCSGKYLMFVDSDDWVDEEIVQKLCDDIRISGSNIAVCNYNKTYRDQFDRWYKVEEKIAPGCSIDLEMDKSLLNQISTFPVCKLIKKEIFNRYALRFPDHFFEDVAMMPILLVLARRISFIDDALYYYRIRSGSTSNSDQKLDDRIRCMSSMVDFFRKYGAYEAYEQQLKRIIEQRMQINLRMAGQNLHQRYYEFEKKQAQIAGELFPDVSVRQDRICVIGSYNLMTIAKVVMNYEADKNIELYFGRESLISIMGENDSLNRIRIGHEVPMKQKCLINDFSRKLVQYNPEEFQKVDYIFIDLLEERFDVGMYREEPFTLSDAFYEVERKLRISYDIIRAESEEWFILWEEACAAFLERMLLYVRPEQIVLVESKLTEQYIDRDGRYNFPETEQIRKCNARLQKCYDVMKRMIPGCRVIEIAQMDCYVTGADFRHGCYPWHLGNMAYVKIGEYIKEVLRDENGKTETAALSCLTVGKTEQG